jgi:hypothetical protein
MSVDLIRALIRETLSRPSSQKQIITQIQDFVGMNKTDQDGVWGEQTDRAVVNFVYGMMNDAEVYPRDIKSYQIASDWAAYGPKIMMVNGNPASYTGNAKGFLKFLHDLTGTPYKEPEDIQAAGASQPPAETPTLQAGEKTHTGKRALAVGDSQMVAQIGSTIRKRLADSGYSVTFVNGSGKNANGVLAKFNEAYRPGYFDLVVTTIGGNGSLPAQTEAAIRSIHEKIVGGDGGHLIAIGPPPATRITDTSVAGPRSWGAAARDPMWMLNREGGKFAANRRAVSQAVDNMSLDNTFTYGVSTRVPDYPDQPDGLHCAVGGVAIADDILTQARSKGIPV